MPKLLQILLMSCTALVIAFVGCDNRKGVNTGTPGGGGDGGNGEVTYRIDSYAFRDLVQRVDIVWVSVDRNASPYNNASVRINNHTLALADTGVYLESDYGLLEIGQNRLTVEIQEDNLNKSLFFVIPDSFSVIEIARHNPGAYDRFIRWSECRQASKFLLAVRGRNSEQTGVAQYSAFIDTLQYFYNIPTQAFRNRDLIIVPDIYYLYIVGYTSGLTSFEGTDFSIPSGYEGAGFSGIPGNFSAGLMAPLDSFIVTF